MSGNQTKNKLSKNAKRYLFLIGIFLILFVFFSVVESSFLSVRTMMNIVKQNASLAILSLGVTFVIMIAGTDLSTGSNIAFSGACGALAMQAMGGGSSLAVAITGILVTVGVGVLIGALNGALIGFFNINPFMVTLATSSLASGLVLYITNSRRVVVDNDIYNWIGQYEFKIGTTGISVPGSIIILIILIVLMHFVLTRTTFGRKTYAVGGNAVTSKASGINVKRHIFYVYTLCGAFAGLAAIVTVGRALSAQPTAGQDMEFDAITAVVIGGASLAGGTGSLPGSVIGAFLIGIIFSGLGMMSISPNYSYIVKGALIIIAVYMDQWAGKERKKKDTQGKQKINNAENRKGDFNKIINADLVLNNIIKEFPGVRALDNVKLAVDRGQVHALMGENGAGKSTLMKVLSGVYKRDGGEILIDGKPVDIKSPMDSQKAGISVIYQELALVPELTIAQNIFLGKEIRTGEALKLKDMNKRAQELIDRFEINVSAAKKVGALTVGQMQMVEIAKAVNSNAWVIVMDEPTSSITDSEKDKLFEIISELKEQGIAIIYISHRMSEIFDISDEITVLRDGQYVATYSKDHVTEDDIIKSMVGRELDDVFSREKTEPGDVVFEVKNLSRKGVFEPVSFTVRSGEVLGISGLMGAGRTEIVRCIFGLDKPDTGEVWLNGEKLDIKSVYDAIKAGIAYVSEDRRREGIVPLLTLRENISLPSLPWISRMGIINAGEENEISQEYIEKLAVKCTSQEQTIGTLSGGNQQKVCLAKWLCRKPSLIILDEPTRGIDIGAKAEIHKLIENLCAEGIAVIMISSELPEVLGSSNRIMVLYEGKVTKLFEQADDTTQEMIMAAASGEISTSA